jgi:hypothetical protein
MLLEIHKWLSIQDLPYPDLDWNHWDNINAIKMRIFGVEEMLEFLDYVILSSSAYFPSVQNLRVTKPKGSVTYLKLSNDIQFIYFTMIDVYKDNIVFYSGADSVARIYYKLDNVKIRDKKIDILIND